MAARASMAGLITQLRGLIYDPAGTSQVFSDDELQDACDHYVSLVWHQELEAAPTYTTSGVVYKQFYANAGNWEADVLLQDANHATLVPSSSNLVAGYWTFNDGQEPPVYITGKHYNLYIAAADILEQWAAREKLTFDFSADGAQYRRSQKVEMLLQLAAQYRLRQRPRTIPQVRGDLAF